MNSIAEDGADTGATAPRFFVVDTFTRERLSGNPAVVCLLGPDAAALSPKLLLRVAGELASVEVAFVMPTREPKVDFALRFMTATTETEFCGHATLAAAHVLFTTVAAFRTAIEVHFKCVKSGNLVIVRRVPDTDRLELGLQPTLPVELELAPERLRALTGAVSLAPERVRAAYGHASSKNLVLVLRAPGDVIAAAPQRNAILRELGREFSKLTITARIHAVDAPAGLAQHDVVSRLFAPLIGIDEDAVSGASHAMVGALWRVLEPDLSEKPSLLARQASPRGGDMHIAFHGTRVGVSGPAIITAVGQVRVPTSRSNL